MLELSTSEAWKLHQRNESAAGMGKVLKYIKELNFSFVYILILQIVNP